MSSSEKEEPWPLTSSPHPSITKASSCAVLSEGWVYSEAWTSTAWVRAGLLSDVLKGRPLSATDLERLDLPADADPSPRPAPEPPSP